MSIDPTKLQPPPTSQSQSWGASIGGFVKQAATYGGLMATAMPVKEAVECGGKATFDTIAHHPYAAGGLMAGAYAADKAYSTYQDGVYAEDRDVLEGRKPAKGKNRAEFYHDLEKRIERVDRRDPSKSREYKDQYVDHRTHSEPFPTDNREFRHNYRPPKQGYGFREVADDAAFVFRRGVGLDVRTMDEMSDELLQQREQSERAYRNKWGLEEPRIYDPTTQRKDIFQ